MERIWTDVEGVTWLTDAELAEQITSWSGRVAAGEARLLTAAGGRPDRHGDDRLGEPVPHHPALPWGDPALLDRDGDVSAEASVPDVVDPMDLDDCVAVLVQQAA